MGLVIQEALATGDFMASGMLARVARSSLVVHPSVHVVEFVQSATITSRDGVAKGGAGMVQERKITPIHDASPLFTSVYEFGARGFEPPTS
jgi:hypothetical protein